MPRVLLRNATVWSWISTPREGKCDGHGIERQRVVIDDGVIIAVGDDVTNDNDLEDFDTIIDCGGELIIPGLIGEQHH
jgi:imidazolonepropionase-like amidohydrolase